MQSTIHAQSISRSNVEIDTNRPKFGTIIPTQENKWLDGARLDPYSEIEGDD